ncbi:MCP four helix bundle domain-containing protein [Massilia scottii]|uniref:MCP four helix bundle domain-containing protein n=1 Tax=Massilia scottii TaxID=3057166 RepID=UPI002796A32B|nr:MCP four helix bundle domain-containing protein [Massilia sp. CCM 9029]MDQ1830680.1 MCP four helix bundle domain-containing protein [Massilia sp. CCM 9029]
MFLLIVVLSAMAISRVGGIEDSLNQINKVNNVKQRYAINFRGSVHDCAIALRDVVLAADAAAVQPHLDLIRQLAGNYARSAAPLDALVEHSDTTAEEKAALAGIKESERKTQPLIASVIALRLADKLPEANALLADQATQQNAALVEQAAAAASSLNDEAASLTQVVGVFVLAEGAARVAAPAARVKTAAPAKPAQKSRAPGGATGAPARPECRRRQACRSCCRRVGNLLIVCAGASLT